MPGLLEPAFGLADWPMSEDCLSLNVWTPAADRQTAGRCWSWIHGGAFTNGTGAVPWYDGGRVRPATVRRRHAQLPPRRARLPAPGRPRRRAVRRLRQPRPPRPDRRPRVGAGQHRRRSAATRATSRSSASRPAAPASLALLACPGGRRPVPTGRRPEPVASSSCATRARPPPRPSVLARLGIGPGELDRLFAVPVPACSPPRPASSAPSCSPPSPRRPTAPCCPGPVADGAAGRRAVPLLIGTNRDELYLFTALDGRRPPARRRRAAHGGAPHRSATGRRRPRSPPTPPPALAATPGPARRGHRHRRRLLAARHRSPSRGAVGPPTWMYRFDWPTPVFGGLLGACHGIELPFVFHTLDGRADFVGDGAELPAARRRRARRLAGVRRDGDPGWPAYDADRRATMRFDDGERRGRRSRRRPAACWSRFGVGRAG